MVNRKEIIDSPTASLHSGEYYREQVITLKSNISGTQLYYTTDGTLPSKNSIMYGNSIKVKENLTIKAIAIHEESNVQSEVSTFTYKITTRQDIAQRFMDLNYNNMPYRLYVPENYDPSHSYPLVLFLHGGGERGTDNVKQLLANDGAIIWAAPENQKKNPAFILAPQARDQPDGGFAITRNADNIVDPERAFEFSSDLAAAYDILQMVMTQYNINQNRVYSTGLSQGGFGTFNLNIKYPNLFAALVPIAGGGDPEKVHIIKNKPLWAFHAEDDEIIPVSSTRNAIQAIRSAGGTPIYTEYPANLGHNHESWNPAYENQEMIAWMFSQRKDLK
ncbi:chitobiase/beta-hexosaminidase C-terminal domain-containing protein [Halobacillus massiliensis]|uniref:chitobiase/beta-hexosaminidase C-terminal domain-containing protein n=1 Tax=Halobacillus massiliensis TaxID=1926286 RepID=UPI0009E42CA2|nr:chitobiase/beta-hexosaminidase C-terminal domain-containing protein [Halobacillus massiliensis]